MLVLSRRQNEWIEIRCPDGSTLRLTVAQIRGDKVRIGLEAPANYEIFREEIAPEHRRRPEARTS